MNTNVAPIPELSWLFHESESDIGYRSTQGGIQTQLELGTMPKGSAYRSEKPVDPDRIDYIACKSSAIPTLQTDPLAAALLPGWISPRVPSTQERWAAAKLRRAQMALRQLSPLHQAVIGHAYTMRNIAGEAGGPKLLSQYGQAAGAVRHVLVHYQVEVAKAGEEARRAREAAKVAMKAGEGTVEAKQRTGAARKRSAAIHAAAKSAPADAVRLLRDAHRAFTIAARSVTAELRAQRDRARAASQHRREALLAEMLGLPKKERLAARARAWMQEMGIEVEDVGTSPGIADGAA
jgi:hypothetical protein